MITIAYPAYAINNHPQGIIVDGSLTGTSSIELTGPDYQIKAAYGRLEQTNLFHSFSQFNLHSGERAIFSGPKSVQNIISRVSGHNVSWIDGRIESSIPNANLYLLNPFGVIFGNNASLDIGGSFYVSTADYLKLDNHGVFNTNGFQELDILTTESPTAFGFIDSSSMASIVFEGGEKTNDTPDLGIHVSSGQRISVFAGNIEIQGAWYHIHRVDDHGNLVFEQVLDEWGHPVYKFQTNENGEQIYDQWGWPVYQLDENGNQIPVLALDENNNPIPVMDTIYPPTLLATGGQIQLITCEPKTEIPIDSDEVQIENLEGTIYIEENANIDVSGPGGGDIIIKGGQFFLDQSMLLSETFENIDGGKIDIQANDVNLIRGAQLSVNTYGTGKGADISIDASNEIFAGLSDRSDTIINAISENNQADFETGDCGKITLNAKAIMFHDSVSIFASLKGSDADLSFTAETISFANNVYIKSVQFGATNADISIISKDMLELQSANIIVGSEHGTDAQFANAGNIYIKGNDVLFSESSNIDYCTYGDGGDIIIEGNTISFMDSAYIHTMSYNSGTASRIQLLAKESLLFSGKTDIHQIPLDSSYIKMSANFEGNLPSLTAHAQNMSFINGAYIESENMSTGKGANITLKASETIHFHCDMLHVGFSTSNEGIVMNANGETGIHLKTNSLLEHGGDVGNLLLEAENIFFTHGAFIKANTIGTGMGGNVTLIAREDIFFDGEATLFFENEPLIINDNLWNTQIDIKSSGKNTNSGNAGTLNMSAKNIGFSNGAMINSETLGTGEGGSVNLFAEDSVEFRGEDDDNTVSGIYASTKYSEPNAGDAGPIEINAHHFILSKGARINSSSYGSGNGGNIQIFAEKISLSSADSLGMPSNIYSGSESTSLIPGDGGTIFLSAKNISLSSQAFLSTASKGNGKAGNIELHADSIHLDDLAAVSSGSESENYYVVENRDAIDTHFILSGDRICVSETAEKRYVFTGKLSGGGLCYRQYFVFETSEDLSQQIFFSEGDMAHVLDDGTGKSSDYIALLDPVYKNPIWLRFDSGHMTTFPDMTEFIHINNTNVPENEVPPYANSIIKVLDAGNGKEGLFVFTSQKIQICFPPLFFINVMRIGHLNLDDTSKLNEISEKLALENGDHFTIDTDNSEYVFYNGEFIKLNSNVHFMDSKDGIFDLIQVQTGDFVTTIDDGKNYIYSGKDWLTPGNADLIVPDLAAMNHLAPESGDIVYVVDTDNHADNEKQPGNFLFANNQWIPFSKGKGSNIKIEGKNLVMHNSRISTSTFGHGSAANISINVDNIKLDAHASIQSESTAIKFGGSAGTIQIHSKDSVKLLGNSSLSTKTLDAGGGRVFVDADKSISLLNGEITSSVKQGAGEGGDVNIRSELLLMNHGKITANADEGDGGAIFITADYFIKSADSPIEATSQRGNDGTVEIDAPDINISKGLIALPSTLLNASQWVRTPCEKRTVDDSSRFIIKGRDAVPARYDDFSASPPSEIER